MGSPTITLSYQGPASESSDLLLIEQEDWDKYVGKVTTGSMVRALREMLYGEDSGSLIDCGLTEGNVACLILVYPKVLGLDYQFAASYGTLSERLEEVIEEKETLNFSLESSASPSHPPLAISGAVWADLVYDAEGNGIAPPPLTITDGAITTTIPVYGAVDVSYTTERHAYTLVAPRREDAIDNFYTSAVCGWYIGGVNWLVVDMPPGIETFNASADAVCGGDSGFIETPDDDEPGDEPVTGNRRSIVDYCSQEIVEDDFT